MSWNWDWLWYIASAALGLLGAWLLYWALLHDRFKKPRRRRCPKCWYDMSGSPSRTCSECGYSARRERSLFKIRRRWRLASMSAILMLVAVLAAQTPHIARSGWASRTPTTLLVILAPYLKGLDKRAEKELRSRIEDEKLWDWQLRLLLARVRTNKDPWVVTVSASPRWPEKIPLYGDVSITPSLAAQNWFGQKVKMELKPLFDPDVKKQSRTIHRKLQGHLLGMPPAGENLLEFEYLMNFRCERDRAKPPVTLHRSRTSVWVNVSGSLEDFLATSDFDLRRYVSFDLRNDILLTRTNIDEDRWDNWAFPVTIELLRNGEVMTTLEDWWEPSKLAQPSVVSVPSDLRGDMRPFGTWAYADYKWSLYVKGNPGRALHEGLSTGCWVGSFDAPLGLVETPDELLFRTPMTQHQPES